MNINDTIKQTASMYIKKILCQKHPEKIQDIDTNRHIYAHTNARGRTRYFMMIPNKKTMPLSLYFSPNFMLTKYNGFFIAIAESPECFAELEGGES